LRSLADPLPDLSVTVDGTAHRAAWLVVTRARRYGGSFLIAHGADLRDENLIAVLFQAGSRSDLVRLQLALVYGSLERARGVLHLPCTRVSVRASTPVACQVDGDPFGRTPLTIEASGPNLRLIVPPAYEKCRPA
jgi:diacylglycerol kinase family enzyme